MHIFSMIPHTHDIDASNMCDDPRRIWCKGFGKEKQQFLQGWQSKQPEQLNLHVGDHPHIGKVVYSQLYYNKLCIENIPFILINSYT